MLGDLRRHLFHSNSTGDAEITSSAILSHGCQRGRVQHFTLLGGAALDASAIAAAVDSLVPSPELITHSYDDLQRIEVGTPLDLFWAGFGTKPNDSNRSLRLSPPQLFEEPRNGKQDRIIRFPCQLASALAKYLGDPTRAEATPIDLLVINDLNLGHRDLILLDKDSFGARIADVTASHNRASSYLPDLDKAWLGRIIEAAIAARASLDTMSLQKLLEEIATRPPDFGILPARVATDQIRDYDELRDFTSIIERLIYGFCLDQLLAMLESNNPDSAGPGSRRHLLWPLIILNVDSSLPILAETNATSAPSTLWERIYASPTLRQRTIVILDADTLRHDGLPLSSGLSWEQCAQDLINSLNTVSRFAFCRSMGHILVRFGIAGILYAEMQKDKPHICRLFFDPSCDDSHQHPEPSKSNIILGYSSVLVALLVKSVTRVCNNRPTDPASLNFLGEAIDSAATESIAKCQLLYNHGYGRKWQDFFELAHPTALKDGVPVGMLFPRGLFRHPLEIRLDDADEYGVLRLLLPEVPIGRVSVDVDGTNNNWAIAVTSAHAKLNELATRIVRQGVELAINQVSLTYDACVDCMEVLYALVSRRAMLNVAPTASTAIIDKAIEEYSKSNRKLAKESRLAEAKQALVTMIALLHDLAAPNLALSDALELVMGTKRADDIVELASESIKPQLMVNSIKKLLGKLLESSSPPALPPPRQIVGLLCREIRLEERFTREDSVIPVPFERLGRQRSEGERDTRIIVIDRRELEGIRFIRNLIAERLRDSLKEDKPTKPLSLGVFGPPGSGKSTAVRRVIEGLPDVANNVDWIRANLSELTKPEQLEAEFGRITNAMAEKKIPIAFFDEFDCQFDNQPLGWLKFFLAPMEDGEYKGKKVGNAIFVFAGGTASTFSQFARLGLQETAPEFVRFVEAKGRDFVSRLRGHLDIVGVNRIDQRENDDAYVFRRAVVLRSFLEQIQGLSSTENVKVDDAVLKAMLSVPEYKHGARSMRNMLELFRGRKDGITRSSLPPIAQIDMHVDGQSFFQMLNEYSNRDCQNR